MRVWSEWVESERAAWIRQDAITSWARHPLAIREQSRLAYYRNHEENKRRSKEAAKDRYYRTINQPEFKLKRTMRSAISRICRKSKTQKDRKTIEYLGCTMQHARKAIEQRFKPGMRWDNHGKEWEIDHIVPLSMFDLRKNSDRMMANHISNLQPLWKSHNRAKANRYEEPEMLVLV